MKTWIKRTLIGLTGVGILFGGMTACAGHHWHNHHGANFSEADMAKMRDKVIDRASRELALDEAQKAKLGVLADALNAQRLALRGAGDPAAAASSEAAPRAQFAALIAGNSFDRSRAQALVDAKTAAVTAKAPALVAAAGDFFDSLKPEQQQKLRDLLARRGGHRFGPG